MNKIIEVLSEWQGRQAVESALLSRGFGIARAWQRLVADHCGETSAFALESYWDEIARECVCSAGLANSKGRMIPALASYRSPLLDSLFAKVNYSSGPFVDPELLPGLQQFEERCYASREASIEITNRMEHYKQAEIDTLRVSSVGWSGTKRCAREIFRSYIEPLGFLFKKQCFLRRGKNGLVLRCMVDVGGRPNCIASLPIKCFIELDDEERAVFEVGAIDRLVPGFGYYGHFETPQSAVLGLRAYANLFDVLFRSFDSPKSQ